MIRTLVGDVLRYGDYSKLGEIDLRSSRTSGARSAPAPISPARAASIRTPGTTSTCAIRGRSAPAPRCRTTRGSSPTRPIPLALPEQTRRAAQTRRPVSADDRRGNPADVRHAGRRHLRRPQNRRRRSPARPRDRRAHRLSPKARQSPKRSRPGRSSATTASPITQSMFHRILVEDWQRALSVLSIVLFFAVFVIHSIRVRRMSARDRRAPGKAPTRKRRPCLIPRTLHPKPPHDDAIRAAQLRRHPGIRQAPAALVAAHALRRDRLRRRSTGPTTTPTPSACRRAEALESEMAENAARVAQKSGVIDDESLWKMSLDPRSDRRRQG